MAVSNGYPLGYEKGFPIKGLDTRFGKQAILFHAGTTEKEGTILTNGGRVLCITSYGKNISEAVDTSLDMLDHIGFEGMYYRTDIGYEFK